MKRRRFLAGILSLPLLAAPVKKKEKKVGGIHYDGVNLTISGNINAFKKQHKIKDSK